MLDTTEVPTAKEYNPLRNSSLRALRKRLKDEQQRRHDMVVPGHALRMRDDGRVVVNEAPLPNSLVDVLRNVGVSVHRDADREEFRGTLPYDVMKTGHRHIAQKLPVPAFKRGYDYMLEDEPDLVANIFNRYMGKDDRNFTVRTLRPKNEDGSTPGILRAILSQSYKLINDLDVLIAALKAAKSADVEVDVRGCHRSGRRMYVEMVAPNVTTDAGELYNGYRNPETGASGKKITAGLVLINSEVGEGALYVRPRPIANVCTNALTWKPDELRKKHLGVQMDRGVVQWQKDTVEAAANLLDNQVRDAVSTFLTPDYLDEVKRRMLGEGMEERLQHPQHAIQNASDFLGLTEEQEDEVFNHFLEGGQSTKAGVVNAVTFSAQKFDDPDAQFEVEAKISDLVTNMDRLDVVEE